jgi:hypothetical protein
VTFRTFEVRNSVNRLVRRESDSISMLGELGYLSLKISLKFIAVGNSLTFQPIRYLRFRHMFLPARFARNHWKSLNYACVMACLPNMEAANRWARICWRHANEIVMKLGVVLLMFKRQVDGRWRIALHRLPYAIGDTHDRHIVYTYHVRRA